MPFTCRPTKVHIGSLGKQNVLLNMLNADNFIMIIIIYMLTCGPECQVTNLDEHNYYVYISMIANQQCLFQTENKY